MSIGIIYLFIHIKVLTLGLPFDFLGSVWFLGHLSQSVTKGARRIQYNVKLKKRMRKENI